MTDETTNENKRKSGKKKGKESSPPKRSPYTDVLDEVEQYDFELFRDIQGIDDEVTLLRVKIKKILANDPENVRLLADMIVKLAQLAKIKYGLTPEHHNKLLEGAANVFHDLILPAGADIAAALAKRIIEQA